VLSLCRDNTARHITLLDICNDSQQCSPCTGITLPDIFKDSQQCCPCTGIKLLETTIVYIAAACSLPNEVKNPSAPNYHPEALLVIWIECR
jgi:hypothetical protein